jgi:hypothetical protein
MARFAAPSARSLRDNLSLEGSVGWFFGEGDDTICASPTATSSRSR